MDVAIDSTVKKESLYVAVFVLMLSFVLEAIYLILGKWSVQVLFGNVSGALGAILSFFLMGLTVQKCLRLPQDKVAGRIRASQYGRLLMQLGFVLAAYYFLHAQLLPALVSLLFPRIALMLRPRFKNMDEAESTHEEA